MAVIWCIVVGVLTACGVFLMLKRHILHFLFGMMLVSNAINLTIFVAGRLTRGKPPIIAADALLPVAGFANPLPQALILTAIVIGFGLLIFTLLLAARAILTLGSADIDSPHEKDSAS